MTREEKIQILDNAQARIYQAIDTAEGAELGCEAFSRLVYLSDSLEFQIARLRDNGYEQAFLPIPAPEGVGPAEEPVNTELPAPAKATLTKEEVRDKLSTYSNKYDSLDVAAIMSEMGYGKLSDVPAARYAELIERVEASIKEGA